MRQRCRDLDGPERVWSSTCGWHGGCFGGRRGLLLQVAGTVGVFGAGLCGLGERQDSCRNAGRDVGFAAAEKKDLQNLRRMISPSGQLSFAF